MTVRELNRDQLIELKQRYLSILEDSGELNSILYGKPDEDRGVTYAELANADQLIPDKVVFDNWESVDFTEEDFTN